MSKILPDKLSNEITMLLVSMGIVEKLKNEVVVIKCVFD